MERTFSALTAAFARGVSMRNPGDHELRIVAIAATDAGFDSFGWLLDEDEWITFVLTLMAIFEFCTPGRDCADAFPT